MNDDPGTDAAAFLEKEQVNKQSLIARLINIRKILNDLLIGWTIRTATKFRVWLRNLRLKLKEIAFKKPRKKRKSNRSRVPEDLEPKEGIPGMSKDETAEPEVAVPKLGPEAFQEPLLFSKKPKTGPIQREEASDSSQPLNRPKPGR